METPVRDHNSEYQDNASRQYAYDFDYIVRRYMMRTLSPFFTDGKALELGCFEGETTKLYVERFSDLTVIEAADTLIEVARRKVPASVRFIHTTIEEAELEPVYDSIFLVHTLEHLDNPVEALARMRGWLSPAGRLFVVVPNADAASRQIAVKMGLIETNNAVTEGELAHGHRRTYSLDTLEHDVRQAGLGIEARGGVFFKPFANFQFDLLLKHRVIDQGYLDGCYALGMQYPELSASIYLVCTRA
jgi:2-polyprenyl-3-methyl-5-hydroxy-6-metoxy-1,4-benzoquinol methylase